MKKAISLLLVLALCLSLGLTALAAEEPAFTDVKESDWYYDAVQWAVEEKVTDGLSATKFGTQNTVTRAMMVTFLWRMAGSPAPTASAGFTDVAEDAWYADAVNWAAEQGIANGMTAKTFAPEGKLTREQAAAFLYRAEQHKGGGFTGMWVFPLDYSDASQISDWAYESLCWMNMHGVMQGSNDKLKPQGLSTRAEVVTMLYRYAEELKTPLAAAENPAYTEKEIPVLRDSLTSTETATLRFYEDLPNVPYMEMKDFYDTFYLIGTDKTEGVTETRTGSRYTLTNLGGYSAVADIDADTITAEDLSGFTSLAYELLLTANKEIDENYPFLKPNDVVMEPKQATPITLKLGDYGIDLRGGEDGLYLPFGTLSDMFATTSLVYTVYNGEKIYLNDMQENLQPVSAMNLDEDFMTPLMARRAADQAEFTYRELCFNLDSFYGKPGQEYIHEALTAGGLDEVLSAQFPDVKNLLLATKSDDFIAGLNLLLHGLLYDGGHTGIACQGLLGSSDFFVSAIEGLMDKEYGAGFSGIIPQIAITGFLQQAREMVYNGDYYAEQGDTAMIRFDQFVVDSPAWKAFYAGEGEMPFEGDTLGTIYAGLKRAASNPEIKNVIIDLTCNSGGDSGAMNAIEWLMTGKGYLSYQNRLTNQIRQEGFETDANFDNAFDENDQPFTQFHYGILTTQIAFSCGNAFPFFMRDHGAMILGQKSGGGACAIRMSTAGGFEFTSSAANSCIVDDAGESVDNGCPLDVELIPDFAFDFAAISGGKTSEDYLAIFAPLYDLAAISEAMNAHFGASAPSAS